MRQAVPARLTATSSCLLSSAAAAEASSAARAALARSLRAASAASAWPRSCASASAAVQVGGGSDGREETVDAGLLWKAKMPGPSGGRMALLLFNPKTDVGHSRITRTPNLNTNPQPQYNPSPVGRTLQAPLQLGLCRPAQLQGLPGGGGLGFCDARGCRGSAALLVGAAERRFLCAAAVG